MFGVRGLADQLDRHIRHLKRRQRSATHRHQTLGAMLDWSYRFLTDTQRSALTHLAIFRGRFTLEAAAELLASLSTGEPASEALQLAEQSGIPEWEAEVLMSMTLGAMALGHFGRSQQQAVMPDA